MIGEQYCQLFTELYGLDTTIFRYFNVWGPRQPEKGAYATVIGIFKRQRKDDKPLTIVGDGEQTRDFTNVKDVVNANILAMKRYGNGEVFNIGSGVQTSVNQIAKMVGGKTKNLPPRPSEARDTLADYSKAKKTLGYEPRVKGVKYESRD